MCIYHGPEVTASLFPGPRPRIWGAIQGASKSISGRLGGGAGPLASTELPGGAEHENSRADNSSLAVTYGFSTAEFPASGC